MAVEALRVRVLRGHVRAAGWVVPPGCCFAGITCYGPRLLQGGHEIEGPDRKKRKRMTPVRLQLRDRDRRR